MARNRNVSSRVILNESRIQELTNAAKVALEKTAEALHTEVVQAQVVPRDSGTLQNEKFFVDSANAADGEANLEFEGPYARRLYYHPEYNFKTEENPNAKGKWLEDWMDGGDKAEKVKETFAEIYKREANL